MTHSKIGKDESECSGISEISKDCFIEECPVDQNALSVVEINYLVDTTPSTEATQPSKSTTKATSPVKPITLPVDYPIIINSPIASYGQGKR